MLGSLSPFPCLLTNTNQLNMMLVFYFQKTTFMIEHLGACCFHGWLDWNKWLQLWHFAMRGAEKHDWGTYIKSTDNSYCLYYQHNIMQIICWLLLSSTAFRARIASTEKCFSPVLRKKKWNPVYSNQKTFRWRIFVSFFHVLFNASWCLIRLICLNFKIPVIGHSELTFH